ncbi:MAG: hypothetical protein LBU04_01515 [Christensenellaceae bacterium]|nr:hypothetical protein [Christensenellaceae bacterium]
MPRSVGEIKKHLKLDTTIDAVRRHFINPLVDQARLKYTQPQHHAHASQRYINAEVKVTADMLADLKKTIRALPDDVGKDI